MGSVLLVAAKLQISEEKTKYSLGFLRKILYLCNVVWSEDFTTKRKTTTTETIPTAYAVSKGTARCHFRRWAAFVLTAGAVSESAGTFWPDTPGLTAREPAACEAFAYG